MLRVYIQFPFDKYGGGGNQFLKALRGSFREQDLYEDCPSRADVILFNSHHGFDEIVSIKKSHPCKIFIHRIDGPIHLVRGSDKVLDKAILKFNQLIADGIIFQSQWSKEWNKKSLGISSKYQTVIYNAPDSKIFNRDRRISFSKSRKTKLISTSNSSNWRKGFDVYRYLDDNLDFNRYQMTFVGNSPIRFKNVKWIERVATEKLPELLKRHDIYVTASQNDPCSNSLIEALSCGLPAVALRDGGHPELVRGGGELFNEKIDIIEKIEKVASNYQYYQSKIPGFSIKKIARSYYKFAQKIYGDIQNRQYQPKPTKFLTKVSFCGIKLAIFRRKGLNKILAMKNRLWTN